MKDKKRWVTILQYSLGAAFLILSVAAAWLFPGWYSGWQDAQLFDQVTVSSREEVNLLDTNQMEIAQRLRALRQYKAEELNYMAADEAILLGYKDLDEYLIEIQNKALAGVETWVENGLLPEAAVSVVERAAQADDFEGAVYYIYSEVEGRVEVLSVWALIFYGEDLNGDFEAVEIFMDTELEFLYFVSFTGGFSVQQEIVGYLGFDSLFDLIKLYWSGSAQDGTDAAIPDFAALCGADSAALSSLDSIENQMINCEAQLEFGDFTGYACRELVYNPDVGGYGIACMYGSRIWEEVAMPEGYFPWPDEWIAYLDELAGDEALYSDGQYSDSRFSAPQIDVETEKETEAAERYDSAAAVDG